MFSCRGWSIRKGPQSRPQQKCLLYHAVIFSDRVRALVGHFSLATPRGFLFCKKKENFIIFEFCNNFVVDYCQLLLFLKMACSESGRKRKFAFGLGEHLKAGHVRTPVEKQSSSGVLFQIKSLYYAKETSNHGKVVRSNGYDSKEAAIAASPFFRFAVHVDGGKEFQSPAKLKHEALSPAMKEYENLFRLHGDDFGKLSSRSEHTLSAPQQDEFTSVRKKKKANRGETLGRVEYSKAFDRNLHSPEDICRFKLLFSTPPKQIVKSTRDTAYITKRKAFLEKRLQEQKQTYQVLRQHENKSTCHKLLVRHGEHHTTRHPDTVDAEDFSRPQCDRVNKQVRALRAIFGKLMQKSHLEIQLIEAALVQGEESPHAYYSREKSVFNKGRTVPEIVAEVCAMSEFQVMRDDIEREEDPSQAQGDAVSDSREVLERT